MAKQSRKQKMKNLSWLLSLGHRRTGGCTGKHDSPAWEEAPANTSTLTPRLKSELGPGGKRIGGAPARMAGTPSVFSGSGGTQTELSFPGTSSVAQRLVQRDVGQRTVPGLPGDEPGWGSCRW